jgi:ubiquinone/menaquinone biosynthesis C-methylase UbiE
LNKEVVFIRKKTELKIKKKIKEKTGYHVEELEKLGWYDLLSVAFDFPFCIIGGLQSSLDLAELCEVDEETRVLFVGSGTGFTACYWAKEFGCEVVGIDIAEEMIEKSREHAKEMGIEEKVDFKKGDANSLPFEEETFDVVISEFVAHLLDLAPMFEEAFRVIRKGGKFGLNEMFKKEDVPSEKRDILAQAEEKISKAVGVEFQLKSPSAWRKSLRTAGFEVLQIEEHLETISSWKALRDFGGFWKIIGIIGNMFRLMRISDKIRDTFMNMSKGKRLLIKKRNAGEYTGYVLITARRPKMANNK